MDDADELERQLVRGALFTHTSLSDLATRLEEVERFLFGLVDLLVGAGVVAESDLLAAATREPADEPPPPSVLLRVDETEPPPPSAIDCAARLPVCRAVCCSLAFALSPSEVEQGRVRFDLGAPYLIRHDDAGRCVHNDQATHRCTVYDDRPGPCRAYSCAGDERIWTDFDGMVLNEAWINEHLGPRQPYLAAAQMVPLPAPDG